MDIHPSASLHAASCALMKHTNEKSPTVLWLPHSELIRSHVSRNCKIDVDVLDDDSAFRILKTPLRNIE